ncbi:LytR/AlgR family response regulator transcription factor [Enterococcus caccae]|uniref:Response regulatory domain-containing protein n=1 Tax=Enterococcus caccae ATCC BAA-1240 TaxID=1158612 RepID=R3X8R9_9ENTE|nr:LytTR family transcriptional regulator DNA-binding domain-containing protein [Enterococcus caccae]EOL50465.1 hypothetical protein UC7_00458 [Enterococcus caccae ATCC BAA-1240]EOT59098.1 hypothetical protein I580_02130 [Enterococcus caccae ATCC BAA-1240]OJG25630.1 hypothetical protein RU98_GL000871 [Enterococcus caccae]
MTMTITCFIVEDELQHGKIIAESIEDFSTTNSAITFQPKIISEFIHFYENLNDFVFADKDIFIIDIHLNTYFSGIELAKKIRALNQKVPIIFLTNDEHSGIQVINAQISPLGYVVKHILPNIIFKEELFSLLEQIRSQLLVNLNSGELLVFRSGNRQIIIYPEEIFYIATIKGVRGKVLIKTQKSEITCTEQLHQIKKKVSHTHLFTELKSYIINLAHIKSFSRLEGIILFDHGQELYVGTKIIDKISKKLK